MKCIPPVFPTSGLYQMGIDKTFEHESGKKKSKKQKAQRKRKRKRKKKKTGDDIQRLCIVALSHFLT